MPKHTARKLPSNLCLIGMPGSGKTTTGQLLSKQTGKQFIDTDDLIRTTIGRSLQDIVNNDGYLALRAIEEKVICALDCSNCVISTGGSAVYSDKAMTHLKALATVIYLSLPLAIIEGRIRDLDTRGLAKRADQQLVDLYAERAPLYQRYADVSIDADGAPSEVVDRILKQLPSG